jgi:predicted O-methyltransferase YrrM
MVLQDRVRLLGERWDAVDWLDAADLFVLPCAVEPLPGVVAGAMAKGLPIAASAVNSLPEYLGDTGQLLPPPLTAPQEATAALSEVIAAWAADETQRRKVGAACRARAVALFPPSRAEEEVRRAVDRALLPAGDYVSPGLAVVRPDACFPHLTAGDPRGHPWPYLRADVPHTWYVDRRFPTVGFLNRDEVHILYNAALRFRGKPALEIGCFLGWSACHLALAGMQVDAVDPWLARPEMRESVAASLMAAGVLDAVRLHAGASPDAVRQLAAQGRRWPLLFIDGDHGAPAPLRDAMVCAEVAEPDALILLHDLAAPDVAQALDFLRGKGWQTLIYQTAQIMGAAWRGRARPIAHRTDPSIHWTLPAHLRGHPVAGPPPATGADQAVTAP